jgi:hypothetical protein
MTSCGCESARFTGASAILCAPGNQLPEERNSLVVEARSTGAMDGNDEVLSSVCQRGIAWVR